MYPTVKMTIRGQEYDVPVSTSMTLCDVEGMKILQVDQSIERMEERINNGIVGKSFTKQPERFLLRVTPYMKDGVYDLFVVTKKFNILKQVYFN